MSAEVHISPSPTDEYVQLSDQSPVTRRGFLYLAAGSAAASALGACSEAPHGRIRSMPNGGRGGADASPSPEATPSYDNDNVPEASASPTPERGPVDVAGYKLDELTGITWESVQDPELAATIRRIGTPVKKDPQAVGTDVNNYNRAIVLGIPTYLAKDKTVRLALVVQDTELPFSNRVPSLVLPKGTVMADGQQVNLMPEPVGGAQVHPYRLRMGLYDVAAVFLTSSDPNRNQKEWTVVPPHVVQPSTVLANGTYANAHVL